MMARRRTGVQAINPLNYLDGMPDAVREPLPVFAAPYVLGGDAVLNPPRLDQPQSLFQRHADPTGEDAVLLFGDSGENGVEDESPAVQEDAFHADVLDW